MGNGKNWAQQHANYIEQWVARRDNVVDDYIVESYTASTEYLNWYWPRTVIYIVAPVASSRPGFQDMSSQREAMYQGYGQLHREEDNWEMNRSLPSQIMNAVGAEDRLNIHFTHFSTDHGSHPGAPSPLVETAPRRGKRAAQVLVDESSSSSVGHFQQHSSHSVHDSPFSDVPNDYVPSSHVHEPENAYRPDFVDPNYNYNIQSSFQGSSNNMNFLGSDQIPDLSSNDMMSLLFDETPHTPIGAQHFVGQDIIPQQLSWPPIPEMSTQQPRFDAITPVRMDSLTPLGTYSEQHATETMVQQPVNERQPQPQNVPSNWNLVTHRERREPRPRGPCHTNIFGKVWNRRK